MTNNASLAMISVAPGTEIFSLQNGKANEIPAIHAIPLLMHHNGYTAAFSQVKRLAGATDAFGRVVVGSIIPA